MGRHRSISPDSPVRERRSPCRQSPSRRSPRRESSPAYQRSSHRDSVSSPARERSPRHKISHSHRARSPEKVKHSSRTKSPKQGKPLSHASRSPSPRTKRLKRAQAERETDKVKDREHERSHNRGKERNTERERVLVREAERETEKVKDRELERNHSRGRERNSERERIPDREAERENEKVKDRELERNHNRGKERNSEKERVSDREKGVERERGRERERERGMERETAGEKRERQSGRDQTNGKSSRGRHERSTSPSDRHQRHRHRSHSPLPGSDTRDSEEIMNSRRSDHWNGNDDSVAKMNAAEAALEAKQKQQPSFELSGKLAAETNRVRGVTLLFNEPPEARKPDIRWRLYVFKAGEVLNEPLYIHRQSCYLFGRERRVADVPTDHPSCSKQHAVIQFRLVEKEQPDGMLSKQPRVCVAARELSPVTGDKWLLLYFSTSLGLRGSANGFVIYTMIARIGTSIWKWNCSFLLLCHIMEFVVELFSLSYLRLMQQFGCSVCSSILILSYPLSIIAQASDRCESFVFFHYSIRKTLYKNFKTIKFGSVYNIF